MASLVTLLKKKMNNWLAFRMLIHIFIIKRVRHTANYLRGFEG